MCAIKEEWDQATVTWDSWSKPGGKFGSSVAVSTKTSTGWHNYDVTSTLKSIAENGRYNYGWMFKMPRTSYGVNYSSSENTSLANRPKLEITYIQMESSPPTTKLLYPNGGEVWVHGSKNTVTWESDDNDEIVLQNLFESNNNGATWNLIKQFDGKPRSYDYTATCFVSPEYQMKIEVFDPSGNVASDVADDIFSVTPDTVNPTGDLIERFDWTGYKDNLGSVYELADTADEILFVMYKTSKKTQDYPYVSLISDFPDDMDFEDYNWIRIVYCSSSDILFQLYDQSLSDQGITYQYKLPETSWDIDKEVFVHICKKQFKQPSWLSDNQASPFNLGKVTGLQFEADMHLGYDTGAVYIKELEFYGGTVISDITSEVISINSGLNIYALPSGKLSINVPEAGDHSLLLLNASGRIITNKSIRLGKGISLIDAGISNHAPGIYFVRIDGPSGLIERKIVLR